MGLLTQTNSVMDWLFTLWGHALRSTPAIRRLGRELTHICYVAHEPNLAGRTASFIGVKSALVVYLLYRIVYLAKLA